MTIHTAAAWGGIAGMVIAILWIAFADAREVNAALNDDADQGADWGKETPFHGEGQ